MEVSRPGLVSRPDFMGLSLVSRFKGLRLARDYSIETTRPEEETNIGSRSQSWKVSDLKGLGLGRGGLGLEWSDGQVLVSVSVSVSVLYSEAETPSVLRSVGGWYTAYSTPEYMMHDYKCQSWILIVC